MFIPPKDFALGVLSSSSSELSLEEKAKIFEEAFSFMEMRNEALTSNHKSETSQETKKKQNIVKKFF